MIELTSMQLMNLALFESMEAFTGLALSCSIFRVNFIAYLKEILTLSFFSGILNVILLDIFHFSFALNEFVVLNLVILAIMVRFKAHYGYVVLFVAAGYIIKQIVIVGLIILTTFLNLVPSIEHAVNEPPFIIFIQFLTFLFVMPLSWYLYSQGIGFMFLVEKVSFRKKGFKKINALILSTIVLCISLMEVTIHYYTVGQTIAYRLIGVSIFVFILCLWGIYFRSNKELKIQMKRFEM
jgi:hypothetical protein